MRIMWTLMKIILGLAVAIPLGVLALALTMGIVGALIGIAIGVLKLACVGLVAYGIFRLARMMFAPAPRTPSTTPRPLAAPDPYYTAAMRELDAELGHSGR